MATMSLPKPETTARRSSAPLQTDPVRERLGKPAATREVRCPGCEVIYATTRRWQMRCPECNHIWIDRSSRRLADNVRDALPSLLTALFLGACLVVAAYMVLAIAGATVGRFGLGRSLPVGLFIFACAAGIIVLGLLRNRIPIQKAQRRSPWQPESGLEVSLHDNLRPIGPGGIVGHERRSPDDRAPRTEDDN